MPWRRSSSTTIGPEGPLALGDVIDDTSQPVKNRNGNPANKSRATNTAAMVVKNCFIELTIPRPHQARRPLPV